MLRICTTEGSDFSAAYVRSTGCAGTAAEAAGVAFTLINVPVEKAKANALIATTKYLEYFFINLFVLYVFIIFLISFAMS